MDLDFLGLGWARFGLDISIRPIPLLFGSNNYPNTIWAQKINFQCKHFQLPNLNDSLTKDEKLEKSIDISSIKRG